MWSTKKTKKLDICCMVLNNPSPGSGTLSIMEKEKKELEYKNTII